MTLIKSSAATATKVGDKKKADKTLSNLITLAKIESFRKLAPPMYRWWQHREENFT